MTIVGEDSPRTMKGGRLFRNTLREILGASNLFREEVLRWLARISP
jgi:hypothetical protein